MPNGVIVANVLWYFLWTFSVEIAWRNDTERFVNFEIWHFSRLMQTWHFSQELRMFHVFLRTYLVRLKSWLLVLFHRVQHLAFFILYRTPSFSIVDSFHCCVINLLISSSFDISTLTVLPLAHYKRNSGFYLRQPSSYIISLFLYEAL